jgi:hypothetical protein
MAVLGSATYILDTLSHPAHAEGDAPSQVDEVNSWSS